MLVYRVYPHLDAARPGEPGHPLYEHRPQRGGRADHPDYYVWYVARQPEAACGETFGNIAQWADSMFEFPAVPGARRSWAFMTFPMTCASAISTIRIALSNWVCAPRK